MNWENGLAKLLISAPTQASFPDTSMAEIVMAGKSNVGKSSLINGLVNRKNLAYVGQTPGKTRMLNFYQISEQLMLVDAPGYGFANRSMQEQISYGQLMDAYFTMRKQCKAVLLVVDIRRGLCEDDKLMIGFAKESKLPYAIIVTKCDKVGAQMKARQIKAIRDESASLVLSYSAVNKEGIEEIRELIERWVAS